MYDYPVVINDEDGIWITAPDIPEFNTVGDDVADGMRNAIEGMETALSFYVDDRKPIPKASEPTPGQKVLRLPAVTIAKIILWNTMMERGMRKADLRRELGVHQVQGDRLVDFLHTSKMEQVETALAALGKRLAVSVEAA